MNPKSSPPTLDDVAQLARVSTATVSRCLNDPGKVSPSTRERVQEAIASLGYTPNFAARFMAAKRTFTIGAIIPTMENAIFARGLQAFQEALHDRGYTMLVASSAYDPKVEEEQIRTLVARGADGILLIGHDRDPQIIDYLTQQQVPAIVAWSYDPDARLPSVGFDNRAAMRELTDHALGLGHKRLAMIAGVTQGNDRARARVYGVFDAMAAHGLDPASLALVEAKYDVAEAAAALIALMQRDPKPSIVLCGNDVLAAGALKGARELGLDVPRALSITGFDDIELARVAVPELTTVHVPHAEMGRRAAAELIGMIEEKRAGVSTELDAGIIMRASLAPPPDQQS